MPRRQQPSDDDKRGGRRASRSGGKPGKTKSTWAIRNLETGTSALAEATDDVDPKTGRGRKTFKIIGRNNPN
jgi:hypothetical protein